MPHVILDPPQQSITLGGQPWAINTDFKDWMDFYILLTRAKNDPTAIITALEIVMQEMPDREYEELADELLAFLRNEDPEPEIEDPDAPLLMRNAKKKEDEARAAAGLQPVIDYEHDGGLIYAAFMQIYGIDLAETSMHWHKWLALFNGLPDNCMLRKVMGWRATTPADLGKMSKDEADHIRKMKKLFELPDHRTQAEIDADFAAAL